MTFTKNQAKLIKSLHDKKNRSELGLFLVEGEKNVLELLDSDWNIDYLLCTAEFFDNNRNLIKNKNVSYNIVEQREIEKVSTLESNDSALAIVKQRENKKLEVEKDEIIIALDEIKDPGNLGTIIRIADWYGITKIIASETADILTGNALPLRAIPVNTQVHNIELKPGKGGQVARSAGNFATVQAKEGKFVLLKFPSGEARNVLSECYATIGQLGNLDHENISYGKAGRSRWLGIRPYVRGVAMNPVDHPMGGGEGKTSGGGHPVSPWGQKAKGLKTRKHKKQSSQYIVKRRK